MYITHALTLILHSSTQHMRVSYAINKLCLFRILSTVLCYIGHFYSACEAVCTDLPALHTEQPLVQVWHTHTPHTHTHTGKGLPPHLSLQSLPECFTSTAGFRQGHFNDLYTRNDSYKVFLLECNNHNPFCMWTLRMQWLTASLRHQAQMLKWGEPLSSLWIITDVKHMQAKKTLVK